MPISVTTGGAPWTMAEAARSPASPAIKKPTATICPVVFHFARRVTGTPTQLGKIFPQTRYEDFTTQNDHCGKQAPAADGFFGRQHQKARRHQQFVRDRIKHSAKRGLLAPSAREIPIENVCDTSRYENRERDPSQPQRPIENALPKHQCDNHRNSGNARIGKQVWQRERPRRQRPGANAFMPRRNTHAAVRSTGHSDQIPADYDRLLNWWLRKAAFACLHHESLIERIPVACYAGCRGRFVVPHVIADEGAGHAELHVRFEFLIVIDIDLRD